MAWYPFRLSQSEAQERLRAWLGRGWLRPDDLHRQTTHDPLHGVYLPCWLFDGHATTQQRAQAAPNPILIHPSGQGLRPAGHAPVQRRHVFDDVVVPAGHALPKELAAQLTVDARAIVPYAPEYLVGWPSELAQVSLADASLEARGQMAEEARSSARASDRSGNGNAEPSAAVSLETYRLVLMPVWIAAARYRGRRFQVLVHGQSGQVVGRAPTDWGKAALWAAVAALGLAAAGLGGWVAAVWLGRL
ncbi:MAG: hypothetical protein GX605_06770 [Chloroflexi bacterium]|nr:hypothetical protein [Chloroflexota bacterium]